AMPILESISRRRATTAARLSAERWLHDVMNRVQSASAVDEVFSTGLLLDLKVFKRSLGEDLADPSILHAVVMLNLEILARLDFLAESEGLPPGEVGFWFWKIDLQLQRVLRRQTESDRPESARLEK